MTGNAAAHPASRLLAFGAPAAGAAAEVFADEGGAAAGAVAAVFPAVVEQPSVGRIGPGLTNGVHGLLADLLDGLAQGGDAAFRHLAGETGGMPFESPEDFIGHPVSDAGKP